MHPLRKNGNLSDPTLPEGSISIPNERKNLLFQGDGLHTYNVEHPEQNRYETEGNAEAEPIEYDDMEMLVSSREGYL